MEWTISVNEEEEYVEVVTSGIADMGGSMVMAKELAEVMNKNNILKALIDQRSIESVSGGMADVYHRPKRVQ
jgi:hypothetical protein